MHPAFTLSRREPIEEIHATLHELRHKGSGARVIHIECDDPENLFCLGFRTVPESSDGVAHILEHTVLCGSQKYPVKDPFFSMIRRSLNTFMNAMTGPDITFYPAASQVEEDFYNLLEVYLDAVFFPNLLELSFKQEGHRLEFEQPDDPSSPLLFKGIVFNEMKGALASPDARVWKRLAKLLYPDTPYRHESGGDPKEIPELTYEGLKAFHKSYYDPSRCIFFFYGNLPLKGHLEFIHEKVLNRAEHREELPPIPSQQRFTKPVSAQGRYPLAQEEDPTERQMVWLAWLTCKATEPLEVLALSVLEIALMGSDAAPLKRALLGSGLCKQAFSFFDPDLLDAPFCIGTRGCGKGRSEAIETLILTSLKELAISGEANALVEGAIHQLELSRLEIGGEGAPFGLTLFERTVPLVLHGGDAKDGLTLHALFKELEARFIDPSYLNGLIEKYLLNNPHRCLLEMVPDSGLEGEEEVAEEGRLTDIKQNLSESEREALVTGAKELADFQREQEGADLEVLPKITLDHVPKEVTDYPLSQGKCGAVEVFHHTTFTNELIYAQLHFPLPPISDEELPYLRLMAGMMGEVGCGGRSYAENLAYIQEHTGGVGAGISLNVDIGKGSKMHPHLTIGGKALGRKGDKLFPLMRDMATSCDFADRDRIQELLIQHASGLESSIVRHAMNYATTLAQSAFSPSGQIQQKWYGTDYLNFIRSLMQGLDLDHVTSQLVALQKRLFCGGPQLVVTGEEQQIPELFNRGFYGLDEFEVKGGKVWKPAPTVTPLTSQGRLIASPVAFTCRMLPSVPYSHPAAPALTVLAKLLSNQTLHKEIREKGGAYGAGARYNPSSSTFHFYAYRDPHLTESLEAMEGAVRKVARGEFDKRDLEEALLTCIQKNDTPVSPGSRADTTYSRQLVGKEKSVRQAFREKLLALTQKEMVEVATQHLTPAFNQGVVVSFAGNELLEGTQLEVRPL